MEIGQTHLYQGESFENKALFIIAKISIDYRKTKEKKLFRIFLFCLSVRLIGLEPTRLTTPDPKSGAATNYATGAYLYKMELRVQR